MLKVWEESKLAIYFDDPEQENFVRQGFNHVVEGVTEEEVAAFVDAINSLHELPAVHAVVTDSQRYII